VRVPTQNVPQVTCKMQTLSVHFPKKTAYRVSHMADILSITDRSKNAMALSSARPYVMLVTFMTTKQVNNEIKLGIILNVVSSLRKVSPIESK